MDMEVMLPTTALMENRRKLPVVLMLNILPTMLTKTPA